METQEIIKVKKLNVPQEFKKDGMIRSLIKFESGNRDVAMYKVKKDNWSFGEGNRGYEVMVIRYTTKETEYYGNVVPAGSPLLPSNEQFGSYGWSFNNIQTAEKKFNTLLSEPIKKGGKKSNVIFI